MDLKIYTRLHGHDDTYCIDRTTNGWEIAHKMYRKSCNKRGEPTLYDSMNQDAVKWPKDLPDSLEKLWNDAQAGSITDVQEALNKLGNWISACEQACPDWYSS